MFVRITLRFESQKRYPNLVRMPSASSSRLVSSLDFAHKEVVVNPSDDSRLFGYDHKFVVFQSVFENSEVAVWDAFGEPLTGFPFHIFAE